MDYYNEIKNELINNEITKRIKDYSKNKNELETYYKVGNLLNSAGKSYGKSIIKEYSIRLINEVGKKYDVSSLNKMRKFYNLIKKMATMSPKLSYSHYVELLSIYDINEIKYYIALCETQNLSVRELRKKIKNNEYERLDNSVKNKLLKGVNQNIKDFIKNPIIINNNSNYTEKSEKTLQKLILEDLSSFLKELGIGFCFIGNEYKIKLGNRYNYIDLLLYNIKFKCYIVIELKVTELKKEHIGQIETYMNYIDKNIKSIDENNTIGIIIVKKNNKFIMEYCSDSRIITKEFLLK